VHGSMPGQALLLLLLLLVEHFASDCRRDSDMFVKGDSNGIYCHHVTCYPLLPTVGSKGNVLFFTYSETHSFNSSFFDSLDLFIY